MAITQRDSIEEFAATIHEVEEAFERLLPQLRALSVNDVPQVKVNVQSAAMAALRVDRVLQDPEIRAQLLATGAPTFDPGIVGKLRERALAAWYARQRFLSATAAANAVRLSPQVVEQATKVRERMLKVVRYYLEGDVEVDDIRQGAGYTDLANDLGRLVLLYRQHQARVAVDPLHYDPADVERAQGLHRAILDELARGGNGDYEKWRDLQARGYALLRDTYDAIRAAALFVFRRDPMLQARFPSLITASRKPSKRNNGDDGDGIEAGEDDGDDDGDDNAADTVATAATTAGPTPVSP